MGLLKKNLKWHICITNDDSYCAHGHTRTNRCVNGYICMYVGMYVVGACWYILSVFHLQGRRKKGDLGETVGFTNSQCFIKTLGVEKKGEP